MRAYSNVSGRGVLKIVRQRRLFDLYSPDQEALMIRKLGAVSVLAILAALWMWHAPTTFGQDAKGVLANASKAMGADNLNTLQFSGTATEFAFGQAVNPSSPWPGFVDKSYSRTISYEMPGWRVDRMLAEI